MTSKRQQQVEELYQKLKDAAPSEQKALLEAECPNDAELRAAVEKLLDQADSFATLMDLEQQVDRALKRGPVEPSAPSAMPSIEGYEIVREIGRGGMGVVYEARQNKLNRVVALKVLPAMPGAINREAVERFRHEATAAGKLHHTNIVPIYDFGQSGHLYYYAMELVKGQPLSEMIRRFAEVNAVTASAADLAELLYLNDEAEAKILAESEKSASNESGSSFSRSGTGSHGRAYFHQIAQWMADVADALHYAHSQNIIHRDIKPGNLLLSQDGRLMVLDFGLAKSASEVSVTKTGSLLGTLRYMSPEQAMAKRMKVDHRTDIYSLGATMYELLTFQPAFRGSDDKEILGQIITGEPTTPRKVVHHLPRELETICLKTLEKDANLRYATAKELAEDLRRYAQDLPIVARPVGLFGRALKFIRRRKALSVAMLTTAFFVVAVVFALQFAQEAKEEQREREQAEQLAQESGQQAREERLNALMNELRLYWQKRDWNQVEKVLRETLEIEPNNYRTLGNLAIAKKEHYADTKNDRFLEQAMAFADRALKLNPKGYEIWNLKGTIFREQGLLDDAVSSHEKAIKLNNSFYANWISLANAYALAGRIEKAEQSLLRAVELEGGRQEFMGLHNLAAVQIRLGKPEAVKSLDMAIKKADDDDSTASTRSAKLLEAKLHLQLEGYVDFDRALSAAIAAQSLSDADDPKGLRLLAIAYMQSGNLSKAIESADLVLSIKNQDAHASLILAVAEGRMGQADTARNHLEMAEHAIQSEPEARRDVMVDKGLLWFENVTEFEGLRAEAKAFIGDSP
ncbi:MAG: protein kinase [Phycisphaerales bacterium]|nr:protein kinase [Phycisphaerales bacterium]